MNQSLNSKAKKVILISSTKYKAEYDDILNSLIKRKIELFCVVGVDCQNWEEALDWLFIEGNNDESKLVITTSHPDETIEEVKEFAAQWETEGNSEIQIIKI